MKLLPTASCVCVLSLLLTGCQSVYAPKSMPRPDLSLAASTYVVRAGETLETIAFRYDTTAQELRKLNPDAANGVYAGMYLNIRQSVDSSRTASAQPEIFQQQTPSERDVKMAPAISQQAVPLPIPANDQYLLGKQPTEQLRQWPTERQASEMQVTRQSSTRYVPQPGFPVEEVIEDENFVLPASRTVEATVQEEEWVDAWQWPLQGKLARAYDPQRPNGKGIEIVGLPGQSVYATRSGTVDWVARSPDGVGKVVIVRHDDDYLSIYSNAQDLFVSVKDTVKQGDPIATLGANVNDEPLLRFEISRDGNLLNPMDFLTPR